MSDRLEKIINTLVKDEDFKKNVTTTLKKIMKDNKIDQRDLPDIISCNRFLQ